MWILECIAGLVLEQTSAVNVLMGPKHSRSLQKGTFILLLHNSNMYRAGKCPF